MRLLFLFLFLLLHPSDDPPGKPGEIILDGFAQGTTYHIVYVAEDTLAGKQQVDSLLAGLDSSLSLYKVYSLINSFNKSEKGIRMDAPMKTVVDKSIQVSKDTRGLFDITVRPLVEAWGFGLTETDTTPGRSAIEQLRKCTGSRLLKQKKGFLYKKKPCVRIDLNGIAQGYSVDILAGFLESRGIFNYVVELGGEIRVKGRKADGTRFRIGIESPAEDAFGIHPMEKTLQMNEGAVTTSGSYRKYYEKDGKKISHLINPLTGYPVDNELISVTVFAPDAITADAYDNALMLMGLEKAMSFTNKRDFLAAYFIYKREDGSIADTASTAFYKLFNQ